MVVRRTNTSLARTAAGLNPIAAYTARVAEFELPLRLLYFEYPNGASSSACRGFAFFPLPTERPGGLARFQWNGRVRAELAPSRLQAILVFMTVLSYVQAH